MNELKNIINEVLEGKINKGTAKIDEYIVGVELINLFEEKYLYIGFIGADTGEVYNIDYITECYEDFINRLENNLEVE